MTGDLKGKTISRVEIETKEIIYCEHVNRGGGSRKSEVPHSITLHFTDGTILEVSATATGKHYKYEDDPYLDVDIQEAAK